MPKPRLFSGVIDLVTIIGVLFLIITLSVGTYVLTDKKYNFNIFEKAAIIECFPAGTKITTTDGVKNIEEFGIGDKVLSENENGNKEVSSTQKLWKLWSFNMCSVDFESGEKLKLTNPHPLYTQEGWKAINVKSAKEHNPDLAISQLTESDSVKKQNGTWDKITSISCEYGLFRVYNLAVDNNNNYYAEGFLAHNKSGGAGVVVPVGETVIYDQANDVIIEEEEDNDGGNNNPGPVVVPPPPAPPVATSNCYTDCINISLGTPGECNMACGQSTYTVPSGGNQTLPITEEPIVTAVEVQPTSTSTNLPIQETECLAGGKVWLNGQCLLIDQRIETVDLSRFGETDETKLVTNLKDSTGNVVATSTLHDISINQRYENVNLDKYREDPVTFLVTEFKDSTGKVFAKDKVELAFQNISTVEKTDDGFIRQFSTIVRNGNTNEILNSLTRNINTADFNQAPTTIKATIPKYESRGYSSAEECFKAPENRNFGPAVCYGEVKNPDYIAPVAQVYNFADCNRVGLTPEQTQNCNERFTQAYNAPIIGPYLQAYAPENVQYTGSEFLGIKDYIVTPDQAKSSIKLGTTITTAGAFLGAAPEILAAKTLSDGMLLAFNTYAATNTASSTLNTLGTCVNGDPTCGKEIVQTGINWAFLGSTDYLNNAVASSNPLLTTKGLFLNTGALTAQAVVNASNTVEACNKETGTFWGCTANIAGDVLLAVGINQNIRNINQSYQSWLNSNSNIKGDIVEDLPQLTGQFQSNTALQYPDAVDGVVLADDFSLGLSSVSDEMALAISPNVTTLSLPSNTSAIIQSALLTSNLAHIPEFIDFGTGKVILYNALSANAIQDTPSWWNAFVQSDFKISDLPATIARSISPSLLPSPQIKNEVISHVFENQILPEVVPSRGSIIRNPDIKYYDRDFIRKSITTTLADDTGWTPLGDDIWLALSSEAETATALTDVKINVPELSVLVDIKNNTATLIYTTLDDVGNRIVNFESFARNDKGFLLPDADIPLPNQNLTPATQIPTIQKVIAIATTLIDELSGPIPVIRNQKIEVEVPGQILSIPKAKKKGFAEIVNSFLNPPLGAIDPNLSIWINSPIGKWWQRNVTNTYSNYTTESLKLQKQNDQNRTSLFGGLAQYVEKYTKNSESGGITAFLKKRNSVPIDSEQIAALEGRLTAKQENVINVQNQQLADRAQKFLDARTAKKIEVQEGFEATQEKARAARNQGMTSLQKSQPTESTTLWTWFFGGKNKNSGQTLVEFSTIMPAVIVAPAAILYYFDEYFDLGITDYLLYSIDNILDNEQKPKRLTDSAYDSINFWLNSAAIVYGLNSDKELSEIAIGNPNQRPYDEIIQEAIDNYTENNPDSDVYYESNPQAMSLAEFFSNIFSKNSLDMIYLIFTKEEYKELTLSQKLKEIPKKFISNNNPVIDSVLVSSVDTKLFTKLGGESTIEGFDEEMRELITKIEQESIENGGAVSHSFVIEHFLEKNNGDLTQSLFDASNFEEYILRGWGQEMVDDPYLWIQNNILDEYSPLLPYQTLPLEQVKLENSEIYYDYSLQNRLGEVYHAANITALLNYIPPEVIRFMVVGEYVFYGNKHGLIKLSADLEVLKQLDGINNLLESYKQPNN